MNNVLLVPSSLADVTVSAASYVRIGKSNGINLGIELGGIETSPIWVRLCGSNRCGNLFESSSIHLLFLILGVILGVMGTKQVQILRPSSNFELGRNICTCLV